MDHLIAVLDARRWLVDSYSIVSLEDLREVVERTTGRGGNLARKFSPATGTMHPAIPQERSVTVVI